MWYLKKKEKGKKREKGKKKDRERKKPTDKVLSISMKWV